MKFRFLKTFPAGRCASWAVLVLCGAALPSDGAQVQPVADPPVVFSLGIASARPETTATLVLSVRTEVALRSISLALDFDESKVRALEVRRVQAQKNPGVEVQAPPQDVTSTSLSNVNLEAGNQSREGWVHIQLESPTVGGDLGLPLGQGVPLVEIDFLVLAGAAAGFTPVTFATVGPVNGLPSTFFVNRVEAAAPAGPPPDGRDLDRGHLQEGGIHIQIIGEVGFFMRGDTSFDRERDITDPIICLSYLFSGGVPLPCEDSADSNDDGGLDLSDPIFTLFRLFNSTMPFPEPDQWGTDPTPDDLGCAVYPGYGTLGTPPEPPSPDPEAARPRPPSRPAIVVE